MVDLQELADWERLEFRHLVCDELEKTAAYKQWLKPLKPILKKNNYAFQYFEEELLEGKTALLSPPGCEGVLVKNGLMAPAKADAKPPKAAKAVPAPKVVVKNEKMVLNPATGRYIKADGALAKKLGLVLSPKPQVVVPTKPKAASPKKTLNCVALKDKKYVERSSPPYSAAHCPEMSIKGNDGKMYISKANKNGVYTWRKV
jgi:hypothetical protein